MSKLTENLRRAGVFNPALFHNRSPYIYYHAGGGRGSFGTAWVVCKRGENIAEPNAGWYEKPNRWFSSWGGSESKAKALAEAQAWASERFGIDGWAKDPFGSYGSAEFIAARLAYLLYAISLLDLLVDGPLPEAELAERAAKLKTGKTAKEPWFEAAVKLLDGRLVRVDGSVSLPVL